MHPVRNLNVYSHMPGSSQARFSNLQNNDRNPKPSVKTIEETKILLQQVLENPNNIPANTYNTLLKTSLSFAPSGLKPELLKQIRAGKLVSGKEMSTKYRVAHAVNQALLTYLILTLVLFELDGIFDAEPITKLLKASNIGSNIPTHILQQAEMAVIIQTVINFTAVIINTLSPANHFENYVTSKSGVLETLRYERDTKDLIKKIKNHPALSNQTKRGLINQVSRKTYFYNFYGLKDQPFSAYLGRIWSNFGNQLHSSKKVRVERVISRLHRKGFPKPVAYTLGWGYNIINKAKGLFFTMLASQSLDETVRGLSGSIFHAVTKSATKAGQIANSLASLFSVFHDVFNTVKVQSSDFPANIAVRDSINIKYLLAILAGNPEGISKLHFKEEVIKVAFLTTGRTIGRVLIEIFKTEFLGEFLTEGGNFMIEQLDIGYDVIKNYFQQTSKVELNMFLSDLLAQTQIRKQESQYIQNFHEEFKPSSATSFPLSLNELGKGIDATYLEARAMQQCLTDYIKFLNNNPDLFQSSDIQQNCILNLIQHEQNLQNVMIALTKVKKELVSPAPYKVPALSVNAARALMASMVSVTTYHQDSLQIFTIIEQEHANKHRKNLGYKEDTDIVTIMSDRRLPATTPSRDCAFKGCNLENIQKAFGDKYASAAVKKQSSLTKSHSPSAELSWNQKLWFSISGREARNQPGAITSSKDINISKIVQEGMQPHGLISPEKPAPASSNLTRAVAKQNKIKARTKKNTQPLSLTRQGPSRQPIT